jgi:hypothetical protein
MKKIILLLAALMSIGSISFFPKLSAQENDKGQQPQLGCTCLPQGITFTTQWQIDNFQTNYPGCMGIIGDVTIKGSAITNLNGLSVLTSIGGYLEIRSNSALTSLTGLESLTSIGGYLQIGGFYAGNHALTSLTGLENLTSIGGNLTISYNSSLSNCDADWLCNYLAAPTGGVNVSNNAPGCNGIIDVAYACGGLPCLPPYCTYIFTSQSDIDNFQAAFPNCTELQGNVSISGNYISGSDITNLSGLDMVTFIGGNLEISWNDSLINLTGLENLTVVGAIYIGGNSILSSLAGLEGLITVNGNLCLCESLGIEELFGNPSLANISGLNNLTSIGGDFWIVETDSLDCLTGVENLTTIGGDLRIINNSVLNSLAGLNNLNSIGGSLCIQGRYYGFWPGNDALTSLTGLENLTSIGGGLGVFNNSALTSLTGLEGLPSVNGDVYIYGNSVLSSLTGLEGLTSVSGDLHIGYQEWYLPGFLLKIGNPALINLSGLENLNSIGGNLFIRHNNALSTCEVQSICDYLAAPNGTVTINNNAPGCNSQAQVIAACATVGIEEAVAGSGFSTFPNPFTGQLSIEFNLPQTTIVSIQIFNAMGAKVAGLHHGQLPAGQQQFRWDASHLPKGLYFCRVQVGEETITQKIIKVQ